MVHGVDVGDDDAALGDHQTLHVHVLAGGVSDGIGVDVRKPQRLQDGRFHERHEALVLGRTISVVTVSRFLTGF